MHVILATNNRMHSLDKKKGKIMKLNLKPFILDFFLVTTSYEKRYKLTSALLEIHS